MTRPLLDRNLAAIVLLCFLAPVFFINFSLGEIVVTYKLINYNPERVTYHGVLGCLSESWMYPAVFAVSIAVHFIIIVTAFLLSRSASKKNNAALLLLGAFLFYPVASRLGYFFGDLFCSNQLWFIGRKAQLEERTVVLFGNMYQFHWTMFIISKLLLFFYLWLAYKIIFNHWNKTMRIQFFTFGLIACFLGNVFWYFLLGPLVYPK